MTQASATSPADMMSPYRLLFHDAKSEMATTRRILDRVPDGKDDWRPHAKSSTLSGLATHVAQLPIITHIAHHRAQLGVYLRLLGIPLPSTYDPTADEPLGAR